MVHIQELVVFVFLLCDVSFVELLIRCHSEDGRSLQTLPGGKEPDQSTLVLAGVVPDQTRPEGPEVSAAAPRAGVSDSPREPRTHTPDRYYTYLMTVAVHTHTQSTLHCHMWTKICSAALMSPGVESEALRAMETVASHINEMQKIYEDYGSVFDQLAAEQSAPDKQVS